MKIHGVGQISIPVDDLESAIAFYRDVLEIPFLFQVPGNPAMAFFDCKGTRLYIVKNENPDAHHGSSVIYFKVDSAQNAAAELKTKGVTLESDPHIIHQTDSYTLWMAFFRDPSNNLMAVMSEEGDLVG